MDFDKVAGCKKRAVSEGQKTILVLGVTELIKLSIVHSSITRYTNKFHNETESEHPILWCAYICVATSTNCGRPVIR